MDVEEQEDEGEKRESEVAEEGDAGETGKGNDEGSDEEEEDEGEEEEEEGCKEEGGEADEAGDAGKAAAAAGDEDDDDGEGESDAEKDCGDEDEGEGLLNLADVTADVGFEWGRVEVSGARTQWRVDGTSGGLVIFMARGRGGSYGVRVSRTSGFFLLPSCLWYHAFASCLPLGVFGNQGLFNLFCGWTL